MKYDPLKPPNPKEWLAKKESERISMVEKYHRVAQIKLPSPRIHATLHVIIETQLAQKYASTVNAMQRLLAEGLDRHDTIHALCSILSNHFFTMFNDQQNFDAGKFDSDMNQLNAATWRAAFEMEEDDEDDDDLEYEDDEFEDVFDDDDEEECEDEDEPEDGRETTSKEYHLEMLKGMLNDPSATPELRRVILAQIEEVTRAKYDTPFNRLLQAGFDFPEAPELTDAQLSAKLPELFTRLAAQGIYLCHTDHLSDRELYVFLREDGLRDDVPEFKGRPQDNLVFDILDDFDPKDVKLFYKYYADDEERAEYLMDNPGARLPPKVKPPYDRDKSLPDFDVDLDSIGEEDVR